MKAAPILSAFNAGELSPLIDGRTDLAKYFQGAKRCENFIGTVQGPVVARGGSHYVAAVKNQANRTWLIKFEYSATQAYVLEFGDLYVRFYTSHGVLESAPSVPYEIVSPYALADLTNADGSCALKVVQSGDVLYIANMYRTYAPRKLTRIAATNWVFSTYQPNLGPFLEMNSTSTTMSADANTGNVTVTASAGVFSSTDVGRLLRLEQQNIAVRPWQSGVAYAINDLVRSDGKTYKALTAATSGESPPLHENGTAFDGKTGVNWEYQDAGYGIIRITAYTSSTVVDGDVIVDSLNGLNVLPDGVLLGAVTARWQLGAWSASTEYPAHVTFFRSRLFWAGRQRIWGSVPDDYENMAADFFNEVRSDNAIARILAAQDVNDIQWIIGADKLVIGTGGGEFVAGEITSTEPLGPANFEMIPQSQRRVRSVQPLVVGTSLCYVQRAGRRLLSLDYSVEVDRFSSADLAVLANRIARTGIVAMAYQGEPYSIIWCVLANGKLLGFTYDREQEVTGWNKFPLGGDGIVESIAVIPAPDGTREELWLIVRRTINGATKRYVEFFEPPWEGPDEDGTGGDDQEDAFYVDSGLTYDGVSTTSVTGLSHLEGETVQVLADGARQPDKTVSGGSISLTRAASVVHVGLQRTARLVPMRIEAGSADGTSQGKIKRIHKLVIRFVDTLGGKAGPYNGTLDDLSYRSPATPMGTAEPFRSEDVEMEYPGDYETDGLIEIVQDGPLPMTIAAIMPRLRTAD